MVSADTFWFGERRFDSQAGVAEFEYGFDDTWRFVETLTLPRARFAAPADALAAALELAHAILGISYYKAICPPTIAVRGAPFSDALATFLDTLYLNGLGEFAHQNQLDLLGRIQFPSGGACKAQTPIGLPDFALAALGGGKDSLVTVERLKHARTPVAVFWIGDSPLIAACAERTGLPTLNVTRKLDPALFELNRRGALNGHVPVTAINSSIAVLLALTQGANQIVFSNERSADAGNFTDARGLVVNHQYSKSYAFEALFAAYVEQAIAADLNYFSLLRPLSELAITQRFAALDQYFDVFSSCNRNFRILGAKPTERWCGECPKCHFVFAALAPQLPKPKLIGIFGRNLLDDSRLIGAFEALMEFNALKPFECVGEGVEVRAALAALSQRADWCEDAVIAHYREIVAPALPALPPLNALLEPRGPHRVPPDLLAEL
jgi:UDP-N-acetyl-alpha-D-muramoyl-L-alanyl-L-glutamate epimerase